MEGLAEKEGKHLEEAERALERIGKDSGDFERLETEENVYYQDQGVRKGRGIPWILQKENLIFNRRVGMVLRDEGKRLREAWWQPEGQGWEEELRGPRLNALGKNVGHFQAPAKTCRFKEGQEGLKEG
jgi:hypothetical protein